MESASQAAARLPRVAAQQRACSGFFLHTPFAARRRRHCGAAPGRFFMEGAMFSLIDPDTGEILFCTAGLDVARDLADVLENLGIAFEFRFEAVR